MLFYIEQEITATEAVYFSKIYYQTSFQDPVINGASVAPISRVRASALLIITDRRKLEVMSWGCLQ
jgi:hypothetical protein